MVLARVQDDILCKVGKVREMRRSKGRFKWVWTSSGFGCVGARTGRRRGAILFGRGQSTGCGFIIDTLYRMAYCVIR